MDTNPMESFCNLYPSTINDINDSVTTYGAMLHVQHYFSSILHSKQIWYELSAMNFKIPNC